jgi:hypothetical protein
MKRISLIAVLLLLVPLTGFAQKNGVEVEAGIKLDTAYILEGQLGFPGYWIDTTGKSKLVTPIKNHVSVSTSVYPSDFVDNHFDRMFEDLAQREDITAITITKSLMDMIPDVHSYVEENGITIQKVIAKLEHVDIFTSDKQETKDYMRDISKFISTGELNTVVLMRIKNEESNIVFYGEKDIISNSNNIKSIIMFSDNKESCALIRLKGKFVKDDIKEMIKIKGKNVK